MRKRFAVFQLLVLLLMPAGAVWAEQPVSVSHTLTGYTLGTDTVTLGYTLTVKNLGEGSISNVTLSQVPLVIISQNQISLDIVSLAPQAEIQVPFTVTTPMLMSESEFRSQPLFWAGTYTDSGGSLVEFPASSIDGGII